MNKNTITELELQVSDFTQSELTRNEQLRKFMSQQKDTLVCGGFGERLAVKNKCLVIYRGEQEPLELYPGSHGVKTILLVMLVGNISLPVLRWLQKEKVQLIVCNEFGETTIMQSQENKNHALRSRQYSLPEDEQLAYARYILKQKIEAQAQTLEKHASLSNVAYNADEMRGRARWFDLPDHVHLEAQHLHINNKQRYMQLEAVCANVYFDSWSSLELTWSKKDQKRVPTYWKTFTARHDAHKQSARNARHPLNALLNFAYGLLAQRLQLACIAQGLEVEVGFLHALKDGRASLVWDLIEPLRAMADDIVLSYVENNTLMLGDFVEEENGVVKLSAHFAKLFAAHVSKAIDNQAIHNVIQEYCDFLLAEKPLAKVA